MSTRHFCTSRAHSVNVSLVFVSARRQPFRGVGGLRSEALDVDLKNSAKHIIDNLETISKDGVDAVTRVQPSCPIPITISESKWYRSSASRRSATITGLEPGVLAQQHRKQRGAAGRWRHCSSSASGGAEPSRRQPDRLLFNPMSHFRAGLDAAVADGALEAYKPKVLGSWRPALPVRRQRRRRGGRL